MRYILFLAFVFFLVVAAGCSVQTRQPEPTDVIYKTSFDGYTIAYKLIDGRVNVYSIETQAGTSLPNINIKEIETEINARISKGASPEQAINSTLQQYRLGPTMTTSSGSI